LHCRKAARFRTQDCSTQIKAGVTLHQSVSQLFFGKKEAVMGSFLGTDFFKFYAERLNKIWGYRLANFNCYGT
jgi:hypothetical protein